MCVQSSIFQQAAQWPGTASDPGSFLHGIDLSRDRAVFVPASRASLTRPGFLDGREDFSIGARWEAPLAELIASPPVTLRPDRFIFHVSFCGSTYLSRLIDISGRSMVLREPNCLVDLADAAARREEIDRPLDWARAMLGRRWQPGEAIVVKPSSWVNVIAERLAAQPATILPMFVTMQPSDFLCAVFRGGRERMAYTARLAALVARTDPDGAPLLADAVAAAGDPLGKGANLAALALGLQLRLFERLRRGGGWCEDHRIDFRTIVDSPIEAGEQASRALRLGLDDRDIEHAVEINRCIHSKSSDIAFSAKQRAAEDRIVMDLHGATINASLDWLQRTMGPDFTTESVRRAAA